MAKLTNVLEFEFAATFAFVAILSIISNIYSVWDGEEINWHLHQEVSTLAQCLFAIFG